jgi:hypothetical protein
MSKKSAILFIFFLLVGGSFLIYKGLQPVQETYEQPLPVEIVEQYFTSWKTGNYPDMYATLSDGFKKLEPTAATLASFKTYVEQQGITDIEIMDVDEHSNDGEMAYVRYEVVFTHLGGMKEPVEGKFMLKNRQSDIIRGWKITHAYGEHIDEA